LYITPSQTHKKKKKKSPKLVREHIKILYLGQGN